MSLPPDGRKPVSFTFNLVSHGGKKKQPAADPQDAKTRMPLARPAQDQLLGANGLPVFTRPKALSERTSAAVSMQSDPDLAFEPGSSSTLSSSSGSGHGTKRKADPQEQAANAALADHPDHTGGSGHERERKISSQSATADSKRTGRLVAHDAGTVISDVQETAIFNQSPLKDPRPQGWRRHELSRVATDRFAEQISVCIPFGNGRDDPRIDPVRANHIILGDECGTGHLASVAENVASKRVNTSFPKHWSPDKILLIAWQIAKLRPGELRRPGSSTWTFEGSVEGVSVRVVQRGRRIITAYPINQQEVLEAERTHRGGGAALPTQPRLVLLNSDGEPANGPKRAKK